MVFDRFKKISEQTVVAYFKGISDIANGRGAQIKGAKSSGRQNFVRWYFIFVGSLYGTCFLSTFWRQEFCGGS